MGYYTLSNTYRRRIRAITGRDGRGRTFDTLYCEGDSVLERDRVS